jgi:putative membrane-bound dehydrogenase-like protein
MTASATLLWLLYAVAMQTGPAHRTGGNRLAYLDELDPYWPDVRSPKLTTPMWIGPEDADAGVEAAILLSIDDMRDAVAYEKFLEPILAKLEQVEAAQGRSPRAAMSIFACETRPEDPAQLAALQRLVARGVSLESHTIDHPCPLLREGDLAKARISFDQGVRSVQAAPGGRPSAFRTPCCDSLNTASPRLFDQVVASKPETAAAVDSSIAMAFTSDDPELPRELVQEADGSERFLAYLPRDRRFANYVTNYPYPWLVRDRCWELPWIVPTDWQAQHRHGPNQAKTLLDLEIALDLTVRKQGLFTLVFHPHGWIRAEQIVALLDAAVSKHGKKVRFLSARDVASRLDRHLFGLEAGPRVLRRQGVVLDLDDDGVMEVLSGHVEERRAGRDERLVFGDTRRWDGANRRWNTIPFPSAIGWEDDEEEVAERDGTRLHPRFGVVHADGRASVILRGEEGESWAGSFDGTRWSAEPGLLQSVAADGTRKDLADGVVLRDVDGDGSCELIVSNERQDAVFRFDRDAGEWRKASIGLPSPLDAVAGGLRFLDLDEDGDLDLFVSGVAERVDESIPGLRTTALIREQGSWLFESIERGWATPVDVLEVQIELASKDARLLPTLVREDGSDNGAFVRERALWWVNEDTDRLPGHCERRGFEQLLAAAWPIGTEPPPRSAEASLHSLHLRPGFVVRLVASEPLVMDPISIEWGADGKLWVVEMGDYPTSRGGGRVKFLEDLDGDGVYDRGTTFLDGLPFPTGVLPWRDGVLITAAPDLLFAADRDGDGRAEIREVLFTGFGEGNPQHRVNGLRLGLDGWVHGANGDSDGEILSTRTGTRVEISGRDWRCDPDRGAFEAVTGRTQYGRDRNDFDDWFGGNNVVPAWHFVLEERLLRRHPFVDAPEPRVQVPAIPGSQPLFPASATRARFNDLDTANHFTSACSPTIYRDELFGPAFSRSLFVCDPVHDLVHREVIERDGVTFRSRRAADEQASEFLASSDPWFRPVQARTGPDGALWVVDMYRDVIEHPEWIPPETQAKLDLRAGADRGRIYRVFPVDRSPRPIVRMDRASDDELVEALHSPNGWTRDTAQRLLVERKSFAEVAALRRLVPDASLRVASRVQALATLAQLQRSGAAGAVTEELLFRALEDPEPELRRAALRGCALLPGSELVAAMVADCVRREVDPSVLLAALEALAETRGKPLSAATALVERLLQWSRRDDRDVRFLRAAAWSAVTPELLPFMIEATGFTVGNGSERILPELMTLDMKMGVDPPSRELVARLRLEARDRAPTPASLGAIRAAVALDDAAADASLPRRQRVASAIAPVIRRARTQCDDLTLELDLRVAAISLLGREAAERDADLSRLTALLQPEQPIELARAAIESLARSRHPTVPGRLIGAWRSATPELRAAMLAVLVRRDEWIAELLDALDRKLLSPRDLDLATKQRLGQHEDEAIRARATALLESTIDADRQRVVAAFRPATVLEGDRVRGLAVFERKCATCHVVGGIGRAVGPDLAAVADQSPEALLVAVLDPNRAVESRYASYVAVTKSGDAWSGILVEENAASVTLRESGGIDHRIARAELRSLRSSAKSLMVEGLEAGETPQDLADLFAFLRRPGSREHRVVRPLGECGILHLTAEAAEIYGPSLKLETPHRNLGWWQSADDLAAWVVEAGAEATCDVLLDFACDASAAGGRLLVQIGEQELAFDVPSTGGWDDYREQSIGVLALPASPQRVVARAAAPPRVALIDLREIRLVPRR